MFKLTVKNQSEKVALADIPALRKTFALASIANIFGIALAAGGHMGFLFLSVLISIGLMFSALSGWCPLAMVMEKYFVKK